MQYEYFYLDLIFLIRIKRKIFHLKHVLCYVKIYK